MKEKHEPLSAEELAALKTEVADWESGARDPRGWKAAPEALLRHGDSELISIRMPRAMLAVLKEFARRRGVGYQVLMKEWLDDRIRTERLRMR